MSCALERREPLGFYLSAFISYSFNKGGAGSVTEAIGWISSFILVLTIGKQVYKQWHEGTSEGVSKWLFIGQMAASTGFTVYSFLVRNWVFVVTNAMMLLNGLAGFFIVLHHRRRERRGEEEGAKV
jgi:MtN3 and saliva related transmembrane protein